MNTLGQNIRTARLKAHLSQEKLAEMIPVSRAAIGHYENDIYRPPRETLTKIAEVLGTTVDELEKSDGGLVSTGRVRKDEFADLGEDEVKMLRRIWRVVEDYVSSRTTTNNEPEE